MQPLTVLNHKSRLFPFTSKALLAFKILLTLLWEWMPFIVGLSIDLSHLGDHGIFFSHVYNLRRHVAQRINGDQILTNTIEMVRECMNYRCAWNGSDIKGSEESLRGLDEQGEERMGESGFNWMVYVDGQLRNPQMSLMA